MRELFFNFITILSSFTLIDLVKDDLLLKLLTAFIHLVIIIIHYNKKTKK